MNAGERTSSTNWKLSLPMWYGYIHHHHHHIYIVYLNLYVSLAALIDEGNSLTYVVKVADLPLIKITVSLGLRH
jgi:hypothetical protein